jgi:hypothetical protein
VYFNNYKVRVAGNYPNEPTLHHVYLSNALN